MPETTETTIGAPAVPTAELLFNREDNTPISADASTIKPWHDAVDLLQSTPKAFLSTERPDGRPHMVPILLAWVDGTPHFASRPGSRKSRNLTGNPNVVLSVAGSEMDLILEGGAERLYDDAAMRAMASAFKAKYGWTFAVRDGSAFDDNLPGSPEYGFYRVTPTRGFGYGSDGLTATRWRFPTA